ncbi:winged helix-turn-helix domain-containing protein [Caulobacter segnis]|uniref:winged helix-turn-helix domain-containing protein n=1 Tax=Caulobacter segnis TaxID=88688 RepID=UPI0038577CC0
MGPGTWDLDGATRLLRQDGQAPVRLTRREFDLLSAFLRAPRKVLSREDLLRATGAPADLFDRAIDTQIRRLRGKLRSGRQGRAVIETVRGVGYAFQAEEEPA